MMAWTRTLLALALAVVARAQEPKAAAPLISVAPSRVVLEGDARSAEITLFNQGEEAVFEVAFQHFEMDEGGRLEEIQPAAGEGLERLLRVTPTSVRLQPGERQVFRMLLRQPPELATGEYRVHLTFRTRARDEAPPAPAPGSSEVSIQVQTLPGISVPVIFRHGTRPSQVWIEDLAIRGGKAPALTMKLRREGDQSVFGDLRISVQDANGEERSLAVRQGLAIYPSRAHRIVEVPLPGPPAAGSRLRVRFSARDQEAQAEAALVVPDA